MPISVVLPTNAAEVRFALSPLVELAWAWHVLVGVDHHPDRGGWVAAVRTALPGDLVADLDAWSFVVRAVRPVWLVDPTSVPAAHGEDWLAWLGRVPPDELAASTLRPLLRVRGRSRDLADRRARAEVVGLAHARGPAAVRAVRLLLDDPEQGMAALAAMLGRLWELCFRAEWERSAPALRAEVRARTRRDGLPAKLRDLSPAVRVGTDGRMVVDKVQSKALVVPGRGLVLVPTVFGSPHVYVADEPDRPLVVHYPFPAPARAADRRLTLRRFGVLGHPARLEICRAIAVEPRSAREIARLWRYTESAVTKHLSVLRAAGLVRAERVGHFVRYTLDGSTVETLGGDLLDVLRR
jgi:DNA-binding transcriptional ArsR family regulator